MKGIVRFFNNTVSWIFAVFCLMLALGVSTSDGFGISSILLLITAIAATPLRPIKNFWRVVLKSRKKLKPVILVIALFVAIDFSTGTDNPSPTPSNTSVSATVETTTATAPSIVELKAEDPTEAPTLAPTEVTTEATTEATT